MPAMGTYTHTNKAEDGDAYTEKHKEKYKEERTRPRKITRRRKRARKRTRQLNGNIEKEKYEAKDGTTNRNRKIPRTKH